MNKGITVDTEDLKRQYYYEAMGFDPATGAISEERIKVLGLESVLGQKVV
jgi:hypothetical protein